MRDVPDLVLPDLLGVPELARWLGQSESAARAHLRAGRIAGRKIGRAWYCSREALLRAVDPAHVPPPPLRLLRDAAPEVRP